MAALLIGYARVSTDEQDLTAQREGLAALGVSAQRIYVYHGLTGANRDRPAGLHARCPTRARFSMTSPGARSDSASAVRCTTPPIRSVGCCSTARLVTEIEADLIRLRTREGMKVATAKGRLRHKQPKLNPAKRRTSSPCTAPASTVPPRSAISSASRARPSTAQSGEISAPTPSATDESIDSPFLPSATKMPPARPTRAPRRSRS